MCWLVFKQHVIQTEILAVVLNKHAQVRLLLIIFCSFSSPRKTGSQPEQVFFTGWMPILPLISHSLTRYVTDAAQTWTEDERQQSAFEM